jgi:hypothetical protein
MCQKVTGLTENQRRVIPFLLESPTVLEACRRARISPKTIYGWLHECDAFREELRRRRSAVADAAFDGLKARIEEAVATLGALLQGERDSIRRAAAKDILELALRIKEVQEIEERIQRLEQMQEAKHA